ncbi:cupredoxin domain-containing protein [Govanella unica]|uniref:Cupredoxin domain-containing protein n=1 Tax=Govanella unica TaxID=2975056 RepID=A0A9X3TWE2_9PROT|nr:cupredoxin domain-containing protein [Govania unica]MDA5192927.1 cupredoxin domain-containing protein [Govania unica]
MSLKPALMGVLVVLTGLMSLSAKAETIEIVMDNIAYAPTERSAAVGDTIKWVNKDIVAHTATARNGDWNVVIAPGKTATLRLKNPGAVDYYCRFHPNMTGRLSIVPK